MARGAFLISEEDGQISAELDPRRKSIPNDQSEFLAAILNTQTVLAVIFKDKPKKYKTNFAQLLALAQVGLVGNSPETSLAKQSLKQLKAEIMIREGTQIKLDYLSRLGLLAAGLASAGVFFWIFIQNLGGCSATSMLPYWCLIGNYGLLWMGTMLGVWISVAASRGRLTFNDLPTVVGRFREPLIRLIFTGFLGIVLGWFLAANLIGITFADLDFSEFVSKPLTALVLGTVSGISEKALSVRLIARSSEIISSGADSSSATTP